MLIYYAAMVLFGCVVHTLVTFNWTCRYDVTNMV